MHGIERVIFFPVRHLSPAASFNLLKLLNDIKPELVLIEGPSDADELKDKLCENGVTLPVALLAYTTELPVDTVLYPFAEYSPEYCAVRWALMNGKKSRFIDLPTNATLSFIRCERKILADEAKKNLENANEDSPENSSEDSSAKNIDESVYSEIAKLAGAADYDDYWERYFEQQLEGDSFLKTLSEQAELTRAYSDSEKAEKRHSPRENALNAVRESYMRCQIEIALKEGFEPSKIVVVTGAYHTAALRGYASAMSADELKKLPSVPVKLTLMPYSYYRLSSRSGYGAGNKAPAYYNMLWEHMQGGNIDNLAASYFAQFAYVMRENGDFCPTSNIIEAVRLSESLALLKNGSRPALTDLHSAAAACIGHGEESRVLTALVKCDIGTAIGRLPEGLSQTPTQDDMQRELKRLKLEKYKSAVAQDIELDLRENYKAAGKEGALLDLNRSIFFNRLEFLGISFAVRMQLKKNESSWKEIWQLRWSPETEIQVVEAVLKGETIELAAAFILSERLENCKDTAAAAALVSAAYRCGLMSNLAAALSTLQKLSAESDSFINTAEAARELSQLIMYGGVRKEDTSPAEPLLKQIFFKATLLLDLNGACDDAEAKRIAGAINLMHLVSQDSYKLVDDAEWIKSLKALALRDDKNPILSGLAFSILLERNIFDDDICSKEMNKRLSPGNPADLGASWFEGLSMRNRYALLSRSNLWRDLDVFIEKLDDAEFNRCLVILRRAFCGFEPREKASVAEILSSVWGTDSQGTSIALQTSLSEDEQKMIDNLDGFDFDI